MIDYHKSREAKCSKVPPENRSYNIISNELSSHNFKNTRTVIDLGCGMNKISEYFKNDTKFEFTSIDF
jgi:hypothetical protein